MKVTKIVLFFALGLIFGSLIVFCFAPEAEDASNIFSSAGLIMLVFSPVVAIVEHLIRKDGGVYKITKSIAWWIILSFITALVLDYKDVQPAGGTFAVLSVLSIIALPFVAFVEEKVDKKKNPEKYRLRAEKLQAEKDRLRAEQAVRREELQRKEAKRRYENSIVEVKIIGGGSTVNKTHGLGGAIVGGALFGVPGAIVGSVIPKGTEQMVRFAVKYGSGKVEIREHHPNSWEYKELMKHVKWEDLK